MEHKEFQVKTTDGLNLFAQTWLSKRKAKALVIIVPGLGEHSSRYTHVAEIFNGNRFNVFSYDLRGHGRSEGLKGHTPSFDQINKDIASIITFARKETDGDLPTFLYGHSLGAAEVLNYGLLPDLNIKGIIATSPPLDISTTPKSKVILAKFLNPLLPKLTMANGLDTEALSHDKKVVEAYKADPLGHDRISVRLGIFIMQIGENMVKNADKWYLPLLLMHGTEDRLCGIKGSDELAKVLKGDITYKRWEGLFHETHNEPEKKEVIQFSVDWINAHL